MTNLTPTELARLLAEGSVRVVRKCEPQPDGVINGHPGKREERHGGDGFLGMAGCKYVTWSPIPSPFPPAGTLEVIDGVECVWGESGCKQRGVLKNNEIVPLDEQRPAEVEAFAEWVWVGHIRKDTE